VEEEAEDLGEESWKRRGRIKRGSDESNASGQEETEQKKESEMMGRGRGRSVNESRTNARTN
jgi:hypothetical protein